MTHRIIFLFVVAASCLISFGCGHTYACKDSYRYNLSPNKPFTAIATCDGEEVFKASGPQRARFYVVCGVGEKPSYKPSGEVTCAD